MFFHEIETNRLLLKNISFEDREFILDLFSTDAVTRYLYDAEPLTCLAEADEIIEFYLQPEPRLQHRWILILKDTNEKIGTCGFHCWDLENNRVELGYDLQENYWGQGIMTEALNAILLFAENDMKVSAIDAHIYINNIGSIQLVKKLGFVFQGKTEICSFRNADYLHHIYTLDCPNNQQTKTDIKGDIAKQ